MTGTPVGWSRKRLGDVLSVKHGFAFRGEFFADSGRYVVVTPGNFYETGGFNPRVGKEKCYTAEPPADFVLRAGDLIVAMTEQAEGLLGSSALVPIDDYYLHNQRIGLVIVNATELADKRFLYYLFNTSGVRTQLQATATGSKVRHTAPSRIEAVEVLLPPLQTQQFIGSVLAIYDDLIENNTRRIEILEKMAPAIYREWFVEFRYPGHENVLQVESESGRIPDGWETTTVGEAFEIVGGGTPAKGVAEYWEGGTVNWFTPTDLTSAKAMFVSQSKTKITELGLRNSSARRFPAGSVMMTSRATIGVVAIASTAASTNQGFITCIPNERLSRYHLYFWLRDNVTLFESLGTGATFKEIIKRTFRQIPIEVPAGEVEAAFHATVQPMCDQIACLLQANENLRNTRDLLLPRLISGEIDVSNLEIGDAA